jgi:hypothetical protein
MKNKTQKKKLRRGPGVQTKCGKIQEKYLRGLNKTQRKKRIHEICTRKKINWKDSRAYVPFKTDKNVKTSKSQYATKFYKLYPELKGNMSSDFRKVAAKTGFPSPLLRKAYNKGIAAWRTGHRPGANDKQWAYARVYSLLTKGKTFYGPDNHLYREAMEKGSEIQKNKLKKHYAKVDALK